MPALFFAFLGGRDGDRRRTVRGRAIAERARESAGGNGRTRVGTGERGAGGGRGRRVSGVDNPSVGLLPRPTPSRAVEPALRSENAPNNGAFQSSQVAKSPPRRGKAVWSAARFVCRMTLYACRSSSRKTRHAIFAGALKAKKALSRPFPKKSFASQNLFREPKTRGSRLVVRWNIGGKTEGVAAFS